MTSWKDRALEAEAKLEELADEQDQILERLDKFEDAREEARRLLSDLYRSGNINTDPELIQTLAGICELFKLEGLPYSTMVQQLNSPLYFNHSNYRYAAADAQLFWPPHLSTSSSYITGV